MLPLISLRVVLHCLTLAPIVLTRRRRRNMNDISRLLHKIPRTAQRLDVSIRQVYELGKRGELEFVRDGRNVFVIAASEDAYVERLREKKQKPLRRPGKKPETEIVTA